MGKEGKELANQDNEAFVFDLIKDPGQVLNELTKIGELLQLIADDNNAPTQSFSSTDLIIDSVPKNNALMA